MVIYRFSKMAAVHHLGFINAFLDLDFGQRYLEEHLVVSIRSLLHKIWLRLVR